MSPETAAARLSLALRPGAGIDGREGDERAFNAHAVYARFARAVVAEAGPDELARAVRMVRMVERNAFLSGRAA